MSGPSATALAVDSHVPPQDPSPGPAGKPDNAGGRSSASRIHDLTQNASRLGYEIVDIAGFLDELKERSDQQVGVLRQAYTKTEQVISATQTVRGAAAEVKTAAESALTLANSSLKSVQDSAARSTDVASWVASAAGQIDTLVSALADVEQNNKLVSDIASQVNFLSINARIEASRAGDAGRGFAVIAQAVNELANRTNAVADNIRQSVAQLHQAITGLAADSDTVRGKANQVLEDSTQTQTALGEISNRIKSVHEKSVFIDTDSSAAHQATTCVAPAFRDVSDSIQDTSQRIAGVTERTHLLIDATEDIVQASILLGGTSEDAALIERVQQDAAQISALLDQAVDTGRISMSDLFQRDYSPIPGTHPQQVTTPFTPLADQLFPPIQEAALDLSDKVVFCAAVNLDGYLPTHNRKFSKPQTADEGWNTAHCRNRRIFDDRVGLKSGRNTKPFLLQVYRRDMGNGTFKLMKDVSAPIHVKSRHWGGLRLAYDA